MKIEDFYNNKYALWIDLRTTFAKNINGDCKTLVQTQSGILLMCYISSYRMHLLDDN